MGTIQRSYRIFVECLRVLGQDKEILLFPVLSGLFTVVAFAGILFGGVLTSIFAAAATHGHVTNGQVDVLSYIFLFVWYFVSWFIVIFFNVAVIQCAKIRLAGGDPVTMDGFRAAFSHLPRILAWTLVSATVGIVLHAIGRIRGVGWILRSVLGAAWSVITYFIIPVMIFEQRSLLDSIRQSKDLLVRTWGEALVGSGGIGLMIFFLILPAFGLPIAGAMMGSSTALVAGVAITGVYFLALVAVGSALSGIYRAALYVYATTGAVPGGMTPEVFQGAFVQRRSTSW